MKSQHDITPEFENVFLDKETAYFLHSEHCYYTDDLDAREGMLQIEKVMLQIANSDMQLFYVEPGTNGSEPDVLMSHLGAELRACMDYVDKDFIKKLYSKGICDLSPLFAVYDKHVEYSELAFDSIYPRNVDAHNRMVENMRREVRSEQFKISRENRVRNSRDRTRELIAYAEDLRAAFPKLIVIRLDVHYGAVYANLLHDIRREPVTLDETLDHREQFLKYIKKKFPALVGYAVKTEYGATKSFHHHMLLFLNGQKVREDVTIGHTLGMHWNTIITKGVGTFRNCNALKDQYFKRAIGMLHHDDNDKWDQLEKVVIPYLCKVDDFIRLKIPEGRRIHLLIKGLSPFKKKNPRKPFVPRKHKSVTDAAVAFAKERTKKSKVSKINKPWMNWGLSPKKETARPAAKKQKRAAEPVVSSKPTANSTLTEDVTRLISSKMATTGKAA